MSHFAQRKAVAKEACRRSEEGAATVIQLAWRKISRRIYLSNRFEVRVEARALKSVQQGGVFYRPPSSPFSLLYKQHILAGVLQPANPRLEALARILSHRNLSAHQNPLGEKGEDGP